MRPRRVLIGGLPYFGRMMAGLLSGGGWECQYLEPPGRGPRDWLSAASAVLRADLVYQIGGQIECWSRPDWLVRLGRRPVVMHWVGSDVLYARGVAARQRRSRALSSRPTHWVEVPWTGAELRQIGIEAKVVALTSARLPTEISPLPDDFTVLTYLPDSRPDFYGRAVVLRLAASLPHVRFLVAGGAGLGRQDPANIEYLGWQADMAAIYARSSVLVRLPEHDGLSFMVLEALAAGRHVIWNYPLDGVIAVDDDREAGRQLARLAALHADGALRPNQAGQDSIRGRFAPEQVRTEILGEFERLLGHP